jgi:predicted Zn-dependent protease
MRVYLPQDWYLVKDGVLVDYLTDRETAYRLGSPNEQRLCLR